MNALQASTVTDAVTALEQICAAKGIRFIMQDIAPNVILRSRELNAVFVGADATLDDMTKFTELLLLRG